MRKKEKVEMVGTISRCGTIVGVGERLLDTSRNTLEQESRFTLWPFAALASRAELLVSFVQHYSQVPEAFVFALQKTS